MPIDLLLTLNAESSPRHRVYAFRRNIFFAVQADSIRAVGDTCQGTFNLPQHIGIAIQIADRQFPFARQLYFIESVGRLLDGNLIPVPQRAGKFRLLRFQDFFLFLQFNLGHV